MNIQKGLTKRTLYVIPGAFCAYLIGSSTATGQEALQFYTSHGLQGIIGLLLSILFFAWSSISILNLGRNNKMEKETIFNHYFGKFLGPIFEWFVILMLYGVVITMLSGSGAVVEEVFGLNKFVGMFLIGGLVFLTVLLKLEKLMNILGFLGIVIIILMIIVSGAAIINNFGNFPESIKLLNSGEVTIASGSKYGWLSGILYAAFCMSVIAAFMMKMGTTIDKKNEARIGGFVGALLFMLITTLVFLALLSDIKLSADSQTPLISQARDISPFIGVLYSLIILAGIYTTAAPMLWTVCDRVLFKKSKWNSIITAAITLFAIVGGSLFPFDILVNTLYPLMGYVGIFLFLAIAIRQIREKSTFRKKSLDVNVNKEKL